MASRLAEIRDELDTVNQRMHELYEKGKTLGPDLDLDADEVEEVRRLNDQATKLGVERDGIAAANESLQRSVEAAKAAREGVAQPGDNGGHSQPRVKGVKQLLQESKDYEAFRRGEIKTAIIQIPEHEWNFVQATQGKATVLLADIGPANVRLPQIYPSAQERRTTTDMMLQGTIDGNTLEYYEETTFTNTAAETAENTAKPEAALDFTLRSETLRKIPVWIPASDEVLKDVSGLQSYIEGRLRFMVERREELQVLVGNGTPPNLQGIHNRSGVQTQALGGDPVPDAVYKAMTLIRNQDAEPNAAVFHPNDWQAVKLLRTADGIYIWGSPSEDAPDRIWGLDVRITTAETENTALVGDFGQAQVFRKSGEGMEVTVSTEHASYFVENKVAILAEERILLAVYRPAAFCKVTGI
jgi:HK97 family phage major capsid protein